MEEGEVTEGNKEAGSETTVETGKRGGEKRRCKRGGHCRAWRWGDRARVSDSGGNKGRE